MTSFSLDKIGLDKLGKGSRAGREQRGVTLIELLIVITILGILSSIAVSSYRKYTLRANRTDGTMTLLRIQVAQEKAFLQYNRYAQSMTEVTAAPGASTPGLGVTLLSGNKTPGGYYVISLPSAPGPTYTVQADATGAQVQDTGCTSLSIDQTGTRYPPASSTPNCWR